MFKTALLVSYVAGIVGTYYCVEACATSVDGGPPTNLPITVLFEASSQPDSVCYRKFGCYSCKYPFADMPSPEDPEKIWPKFFLLDLNSTKNGIVPRQINNTSLLNVDNLIVTTHGFTGSFDATVDWLEPLTLGLLQHNPSVHVLFIEWEKGAALRLKPVTNVYSQAASNTRTVAAASLSFLKTNALFNISKSYCIGFSLGAHVCGFMSKHAKQKWARLSAIDPAAPLFNKPGHPEARVDKTDAFFLDAIHTSKMGLSFSVGHADFFVNSNSGLQPGCEKELMPPGTPSWLMGEITAYFTCGHYRAPKLFAATINPAIPKCATTFRFCPCVDGDITHSTTHCAWNETQFLGFGSYAYQSRVGSFCGATTADPPYC